MENSLHSRVKMTCIEKKATLEDHFDACADKLIINYCLINHEMRILLALRHCIFHLVFFCSWIFFHARVTLILNLLLTAYPPRHKTFCNWNYSTALYSMATNAGKIYCSLLVTLYRCNPVRKRKDKW